MGACACIWMGGLLLEGLNTSVGCGWQWGGKIGVYEKSNVFWDLYTIVIGSSYCISRQMMIMVTYIHTDNCFKNSLT